MPIALDIVGEIFTDIGEKGKKKARIIKLFKF
jgi:hypothetical protein